MAYHNRGNVFLDLGEVRRAIADYDYVLKIDPQLAPAYYMKGICYEKLGQTEDAIRAFELFIQYASSEYLGKVSTAKIKIEVLRNKMR